MKRLAIPLFLILSISLMACSGGGNDDARAATSQKAKAAADQTQLVQEKCAGCHPADRGSDQNLGKAEWTAIVKRMQTHASGLISDEDAEKIINHLVRTRGPK